MNFRDAFEAEIKAHNRAGSGTAHSYMSALNFLDQILKQSSLFGHDGFWYISSVADIDALYQYALENQKNEGSVFLDGVLPPSYGRGGYYSAALGSYREFLVCYQHKRELWEVYNKPCSDPAELGKRLSRKRLKSASGLLLGRGIDVSSKEGKDVLRLVKARVNQDFFRDVILHDYGTKCCVTGLNIPEVLRASHIVAWKDDKKNRLNFANGLCLSATYDAAFDRHLISFDEKCRMIFSPVLKEYYSNKAFREQFAAFEGKKISRPKRFLPDQAFLAKHRAKMPS